jgi:outer membrane protein assembly factor BamB/tetratricopeptide (TPR) repeat protein
MLPLGRGGRLTEARKMEKNGTIDKIKYSEFFKRFLDSNFPGGVKFETDLGDKTFFLTPETITFLARGEFRAPLIGEILVATKKASQEFIETALKEQASSGEILGEILVRLGVVTADNVQEALRSKIEAEIFELVQWHKGTYELVEGLPDELKSKTAKITSLAMDSGTFLREAIDFAGEWEILTSAIDPARSPVAFLAENLEILNNLPVAAETLAETRLVDGKKTFNEIAALTFISRFKLVNLFALLVSRGLLTKSAAAPAPAAAKKAPKKMEAATKTEFKERSARAENAPPSLESPGFFLEEAHRHVNKGQPDLALPLFLNAANALLKKGDSKGAYEGFDGYLSIMPEDTNILRKFYEVAESADMIPQSEEATGEFIEILKKTKDFENSEKSFDVILRKFPERLDYQLEFAVFLQLSGDLKRALNEFEAVRVSAEAMGRQELAKKAGEQLQLIDRSKKEKTAAPRAEEAMPEKEVVAVVAEPAAPAPGIAAAKKPKKNILLAAGVALVLLGLIGYGAYALFLKPPSKTSAKGSQPPGKTTGDGKTAASTSVAVEPEGDESVRMIEEKDKARRLEFLKAAWDFENQGLYDKAVERYLEFAAKYKKAPELKGITLPVRVATDPPGFDVTLRALDNTITGITYSAGCILRYPICDNFSVVFARQGYESFEGVFPGKKFNDISRPMSRKIVWQQKVGRGIDTPVAFFDGGILILDREGTLSALDAADGKILWNTRVVREIEPLGGPVAHPSGIYITIGGGKVVIAEKSGRLLTAAFEAGEPLGGPAGVSDGYVLAGGTAEPGGKVFVFDRISGKLVGSTPAWRRISGGIVVSGDRAFYSSTDNHLYSIDLKRIAFSKEPPVSDLFEADDDFISAPVVSDGVLYAASRDGSVYAVPADGGKPLWTAKMDNEPAGSPELALGAVFTVEKSGMVYAFDKNSGAVIWKKKPGAQSRTSSMLVGDILYVTDVSGAIFALDAATGDVFWKSPTGAPIFSRPAAVGGIVIVANSAGAVYAYENGK